MQSYRVVLTFLIAAVLAPAPLRAQDAVEDLTGTIIDLDEMVFSAFNARDMDRFLGFFARDLEFYHDEVGRTGYAELIESSRRLFGQPSPLHRRLVPGSTVVHPVPGYGALQIGRHEFCHEEDGVDDCGIFGFTHVWQRGDDGWKITRVLSYGH